MSVMAIFDQKAIPKCLDRIEKAKEALYKARNAYSEATFRSAYGAFLIATGGVLHALEAGANLTPQAKQWYGGKRRLGRNDELLQYMHQARNAEEHSTDDVADMNPGTFSIGGPLPKPGSRTQGISINGINLFSWEAGDASFRPIKDKYNTVYPPPTTHLGRTVKNDPLEIAEIYLTYLEALVKEAGELS